MFAFFKNRKARQLLASAQEACDRQDYETAKRQATAAASQGSREVQGVAWALLGRIEYVYGQAKEGVAHLRRAAELLPDDAVIALDLASGLRQLGDLRAALPVYEVAIGGLSEGSDGLRRAIRDQAICLASLDDDRASAAGGDRSVFPRCGMSGAAC